MCTLKTSSSLHITIGHNDTIEAKRKDKIYEFWSYCIMLSITAIAIPW
jgi:hypothetical protein